MIIWLSGIQRIKYNPGRSYEPSLVEAESIRQNFRLRRQRTQDKLCERKDKIKYRWTKLVEKQRKRGYLDYSSRNPDPRIPSFKKSRLCKIGDKSSKASFGTETASLFYGGQGASGMLLVLALDPGEWDTVLDLYAAQGHHSLLLALRMRATTNRTLVSNTHAGPLAPSPRRGAGPDWGR